MANLPLVNLWNKRSVVLHFAWMNIKVRFKGTYLGLIWTAVEPALFFVFLYFLFTSIRIVTKEDFAIYFLTGIIIYHAFTRGTLGGLVSLKQNIPILSSLNIRKEFFPVVSTTTSSLLLFVEIGVLLAFMPIFGFVPNWTIVLVPVVLSLLLILILGFSYLLSIVFAYIKDIQPFWSILSTVLFFVTPIFWYLEDAGEFARTFHQFNPVGQIIELVRGTIFGNISPLNDWLYTAGFVLAILFVGYFVFQKFQTNVLEKM